MPSTKAFASTTGGKLLHELRRSRQDRKKKYGSREHIASLAEIEPRTLSAIELGYTKQPSREILERILNALDSIDRVTLEQRHEVFAAYGYQKPYPIPNPNEIQLARKEWDSAYFRTVWYPAYLVDVAQRLLDWNPYAPKLLGLKSSDPRLRDFHGVDILDVTFKLSPRFIEIVNQTDYVPALIHTMKIQFQPYQHETWYLPWVQRAKTRYPLFAELWDAVPDSEPLPMSLGNKIPIEIRIPPDSDVLTFQLVAVGFSNDPRFFVAQWIPVDEMTALKCLLWKKQVESPSS